MGCTSSIIKEIDEKDNKVSKNKIINNKDKNNNQSPEDNQINNENENNIQEQNNNEEQNNNIQELNQNNEEINDNDNNNNENQSVSSNNAHYKDYITNAIIIWIDGNIDNNEFTNYKNELRKIGPFRVRSCKTVDDAIIKLQYLIDEKTYIIVNPNLYFEFVNVFKRNINDIDVIPKIILFMSKKDKIIKNNSRIKEQMNHPFYALGGNTNDFEEIKNFLLIQKKKKPLKRDDEGQLSFEFINCIEKLALPLFYKSLIEVTRYDKAMEFTKYIYDNYSEKCKEIKNLLCFILYMDEIPIELLAKYYAKVYTSNADNPNDSSFYSDLNKDLREKKIDKYLTFIKVLYEGVRLKSLPLSSDKQLFRGTKISKKEIDLIKDYLGKKIYNLPGAIVFSRSFLSFSKKKEIAKGFYDQENTDNNLVKTILILEKDDNVNYSLSTHADLESLSFYEQEKEVLFFPFSTFEIKGINDKKTDKKETYYEIKLLYLGKYLKDIKENVTESNNSIPKTKFEEEIVEFGLIEKKKVKKELKELVQHYEEYKKEIDDIPDNNKNNKNDILKDNSILSEIIINEGIINQDIRIVNSYQESERSKFGFIHENERYNNEKEIKENCEIRINGEKIDFSYYYRFPHPGNYKIQYIFKKNMKKLNHLFYDCKYLINIDLSKLIELNISEINFIFYGCENLMNINLTNFNTRNVFDMRYMFYGCNSLTDLNLSDLNTKHVYNMSHMLEDCYSLYNINLSNISTENITDMSFMFSGCSSLEKIDLSNFKTEKVVDMSYLFCGCKCLKDINFIDFTEFKTENVNNMENMFSGCSSIDNLNLNNFNTQYVTNMRYMFNGCYSLETINLTSFKTENVIDMAYMFKGCNKLKKLDLSNFNTENVTNMKCMFDQCSSLIEIDLSSFKTQNVTSMGYMFYECNSLKSLNLSKFITENVQDISYMFGECSKLESLNLFNFDISNAIEIREIFSQCKSLREKKGLISKDENLLNIFKGEKLKYN